MNTLEISLKALDKHLAHGDMEGECENLNGGGDATPGNNSGGNDAKPEKLPICHYNKGKNAEKTLLLNAKAALKHLDKHESDYDGTCIEDDL